MIKKMSLFFLMNLAFFSASAQANLITVGDESCEYTNINEAIEASDPGDIIEVQSRTYHENVIVNKSITLRGLVSDGKKPVVDAKGDECAMVLTAGGVRIEGFILKNSGFGKAGIEVKSDDNLIKNNEIVENRWYGILVDSSNNTIQNNTIKKNRYGIWITFKSVKNIISENDFMENQGRDATDLGTNWWNQNLYGDFDGQNAYKIPGGQNFDENPRTLVRNVSEDKSDDFFDVGMEEHAVEVMPKGVSEIIDQELGDEISVSSSVAKDIDLGSGNEGDVNDSLVQNGNDDLKLKSGDDVHSVGVADDQKDGVEGAQGASETTSDEVRTATYWLECGDYLMVRGSYENAIKYYDYAISADSKLAEAWNKKGDALRNLGKYEEAIRCYEKAIRTKPELAIAWCNKGDVLQIFRNFEDAIDCYDRAIEIDPEFGTAWNNKGMVLNRLGRYQEALTSFEKAIAIDSEYASAWRNKSWALQMMGRDEEAKAAFERAQKIDQG